MAPLSLYSLVYHPPVSGHAGRGSRCALSRLVRPGVRASAKGCARHGNQGYVKQWSRERQLQSSLPPARKPYISTSTIGSNEKLPVHNDGPDTGGGAAALRGAPVPPLGRGSLPRGDALRGGTAQTPTTRINRTLTDNYTEINVLKKKTYAYISLPQNASGESLPGIPRHHRPRSAGRAVFPALM